LTLGSGIGKNQDPDPRSKSEMDNPDHIFESLETNFWVKILKFFDADPGWKKFGSGNRILKILNLDTRIRFRFEQKLVEHCFSQHLFI
jgi:hypothetical protein